MSDFNISQIQKILPQATSKSAPVFVERLAGTVFHDMTNADVLAVFQHGVVNSGAQDIVSGTAWTDGLDHYITAVWAEFNAYKAASGGATLVETQAILERSPWTINTTFYTAAGTPTVYGGYVMLTFPGQLIQYFDPPIFVPATITRLQSRLYFYCGIGAMDNLVLVCNGYAK